MAPERNSPGRGCGHGRVVGASETSAPETVERGGGAKEETVRRAPVDQMMSAGLGARSSFLQPP
jgi:hypothetical protein